MANLADGFINLPGEIGTLNETCEILIWAQFGSHAKPCALLDVAGRYTPLIALLDHLVSARFRKSQDRARVIVESHPAAPRTCFTGYAASPATK